MLHPRAIITKTIQVGSSTMISRVLGIVREYFNIKYFGVGPLSDAFVTAFSLPNMMRSIFAEGALSAAFIPLFVATLRTKGKEHANALMTLSFLFFEGLLLILIGAVALWPEVIIKSIAWGFSPEQVTLTAPLLQILIFFVLFVSSSALLGAALQAMGHFFIPSLGQVLINVVIITGLIICLYCKLPVTVLCFFILAAGLVNCISHLIAYYRIGLGFAPITKDTWYGFGQLFVSFFACAMSTSVAELDYFVDRAFASYLPPGSISLLFYANRFMAIPLGVFAIAFSTILMPHFSRINMYAPSRLSYYVLEVTKIVFWITVPVTILMCFFAHDIFRTLFLSSHFTMARVDEAGFILIAFVLGLFFFSLNKIVLNMYYAFRATFWPLVISVIAVCANALLNMVLMAPLGAAGLALSTTISGIVQTVCLLFFLHYRFHFKLYYGPFLKFAINYLKQLTLCFIGFFGCYYVLQWAIGHFLPTGIAEFLLHAIGFWIWVGPLCLVLFGVLLKWRKRFHISLHFLPDIW